MPGAWFRMIGKPTGVLRRFEQCRIVTVDLANIYPVILHSAEPRIESKALRLG